MEELGSTTEGLCGIRRCRDGRREGMGGKKIEG